MIFDFTQAAPLFTGRNRPASGWFPNLKNSGKVVPAGQNKQKALAGGSMYSLLVSNDVSRGRIF